MKLQMVGCSHHNASVEVRERLAFSPEQALAALAQLRTQFPDTESVLISTCNRVEVYTAAEAPATCPTRHQVVDFLAEFHGLEPGEVLDALLERSGEHAIRHLFTVASSLDSMVVGEAQILGQVKQAYEMAREADNAGPLTNAAFQTALRVAKCVASETTINERRVSIPSVAVADFASQIFERFDDKKVLIIGAGEMGEETLRYLMDEGVREITVANRSLERAHSLAARVGGVPRPWEDLSDAMVEADLVISTTGASEPVVTSSEFQQIHHSRNQRPLFVLDLAVPRDFEPAVGDFLGVYLYSIDDLEKACEANRRARQKEWPKAERIIEAETARFMADLHHRATGPTIRRLKAQADQLKEDELTRLYNKLGELDERARAEVERSFDRLINKLLHPPLESLRDEAQSGSPHGLLDALKRLFQLKD
ncbi:MAG: glutamyl-tRNA reductase [Planctomycetes bacterium]|nr:glutamyl-tRNA reductase [Planctomycetota bacterium]MBL7038139.1 glutamyl-tRNA reductase [Pirellulaceae bacterium]